VGSKLSLIFPLLIFILLTACGSPEERAANYLAQAEALYEEEDYVTARIEALNAAQIEPRNADVRFLLAKIEEHEQEFRKAIGHLQVAIDADPNHLESRIKLGNYYVLAKSAELASEQANAAIELAPSNSEVRLLLARVHLLNNDIDAAEKLVDATLASDPQLIVAFFFKPGV
jgi:tetratricopeptide (TPR) repeat protein